LSILLVPGREKGNMAEDPNSANIPEKTGEHDRAAEDKPEERHQEKQAKKGSDAKKQSDDERNSEEKADGPRNQSGESVSQNTTGDIIGGNIHLHQNTTHNVFILEQALGGFHSFESILEKSLTDDNPLYKAFGDLSRATKSDTNITNKDADTQETEVKPLETKEEIEDWYDRLDEWEMCFVQAAAVLHGAPSHQIRDAAQTLYNPSVPTTEAKAALKPLPRISEKTLRTKLYMKIIFTDGADRLFWYDANMNGLSTFAARLLPIIVRQSNLSATHWQRLSFLQQLEEWSTTLAGECAWRALRALGSIWIRVDRPYFLKIVNEWVASDNRDYWRRAAIVLDGGYEVEYAEQVNPGNNSLVLSLLERWTRHAHASFQNNVGCTVAQAYSRIGQRSLEPALRGLEALLRYPLHRMNDREIMIPFDAYTAAVWSYVTLARFGHVGDVLQNISSIVEKYCYRRSSPEGKGRREYRAQYRFMLQTMFNTFVLIAAASLNGAQKDERGNYKRDAQLPQNPVLPAENGQDVLLAAILSEDADWRQYIMNILCGAILEKNAETVFFLLKTWAEITLKEVGPQQPELREALLIFLLELGERGDLWCKSLAAKKEYSDSKAFSERYKEALRQWQVRESGVPPQPLGAFAKDVLRRLTI
jgi:hypothetical protein